MRSQSLHRKKNFIASQIASRARGAQPGFEPDTSELPDYLPMFLEFLACVPEDRDAELLQQRLAHVCAGLRAA